VIKSGHTTNNLRAQLKLWNDYRWKNSPFLGCFIGKLDGVGGTCNSPKAHWQSTRALCRSKHLKDHVASADLTPRQLSDVKLLANRVDHEDPVESWRRCFTYLYPEFSDDIKLLNPYIGEPLMPPGLPSTVRSLIDPQGSQDDQQLQQGDLVTQTTDRMDLLTVIEGQSVFTVPDLRADCNAISLQTLRSLGLKYTTYSLSPTKWRFQTGDRAHLEARFRVRLRVRIPGIPPEEYTGGRMSFFVFDSLVNDVVIIGRHILRLKRIYDQYKHILRPLGYSHRTIPRCLSISDYIHHVDELPVYLDGVLVIGTVDTGCHQLMMREAYASLLSFDQQRIDFSPDEGRTVVFASGRRVDAKYKIAVRVHAASTLLPGDTDVQDKAFRTPEFVSGWEVQAGARSASHDDVDQNEVDTFNTLPDSSNVGTRDIWVFEDLTHNLFLPQGLLLGMDCFGKRKSFLRTRRIRALPELNIIQKDGTQKRKPTSCMFDLYAATNGMLTICSVGHQDQ
jgi:hypothetical protein